MTSQPVVISRHDSCQLVSGDTLRAVCHWTFNEAGMDDWNPSLVQPGELIFAKTDWLAEHFSSKHPLIMAPYILISSNSDDSAPGLVWHLHTASTFNASQRIRSCGLQQEITEVRTTTYGQPAKSSEFTCLKEHI